jgi:hypothetical protein
MLKIFGMGCEARCPRSAFPSPPGPCLQGLKAEAEQRAASRAAAQAAAERRAAAAREPGAAARPGPRLDFSSQRVVMTAVAGDGRGASGTLTVTGSGTAAVFYRWSRLGSPGGGGGGGGEAPGESAAEEDEDGESEAQRQQQQGQQQQGQRAPQRGAEGEGPARFYLPDSSGVILPGEARVFTFSFRSDEPGLFGETWSLEATPPLRQPHRGGGTQARTCGPRRSRPVAATNRRRLPACSFEAKLWVVPAAIVPARRHLSPPAAHLACRPPPLAPRSPCGASRCRRSWAGPRWRGWRWRRGWRGERGTGRRVRACAGEGYAGVLRGGGARGQRQLSFGRRRPGHPSPQSVFGPPSARAAPSPLQASINSHPPSTPQTPRWRRRWTA